MGRTNPASAFSRPGKAIARIGSDRPFVDGGGVVYRSKRGPVLWFTYGQNEVFDTASFAGSASEPSVVYVHRIPLYSTKAAFVRAYPDVGGQLSTIGGRAHAIARAIRLEGASRFDPHPLAVKVKHA